MFHQQFLNQAQNQPDIKRKVFAATHEAMTKTKDAQFFSNNQARVNQQENSYLFTVAFKQSQNISCIINFSFCHSNRLEYSISFPQFYNFDKFKKKGKQRMIAHFNNILTINQNFELSLDAFGHLKFKNSIIFINLSAQTKIFSKYIQEKIINSVKQVVSILKKMQKNLMNQEKYANSIKKYKHNLLDLREAFQKNRKMRKKASSITLKLKQIKIISQVMDLLSMNKIKLNQLKESKSNISSGVDLYKKIQQKIKEKEKQLFNSPKIILRAITIKQKYRQKVLYEGDFSHIYEGVYKFKHEVTLFNYDEVSSFELIQGNIQLQKNQKCQSSNSELYASTETVTKQLIQKRATDKFINVFKNQTQFLLFVRNASCPYIAQYYSEKEKKLFQGKKLYIQKYEQDLDDIIQRLNYKDKIKITYKLSVFLQFLKVQKICHRDIKPSNIMVDQKLNPRVIDWGSCCGFYLCQRNNGEFKQHVDTLMSTKGYYQSYNEVQHIKLKEQYSREQVQKGQFFDIYSFGRILADIFQLNSQCKEEELFLDHIKYLHLKCLQKNPEDRLSALEIHIYLTQMKKAVYSAYNDAIQDEMQNNQESKDIFSSESSQFKEYSGSGSGNQSQIQIEN